MKCDCKSQQGWSADSPHALDCPNFGMNTSCGKEFSTICNRPQGHKGLCDFEAKLPSIEDLAMALSRKAGNKPWNEVSEIVRHSWRKAAREAIECIQGLADRRKHA